MDVVTSHLALVSLPWLNSLSGREVQLGLLWGGLACLTLALIILSRTRWGQARPVWKCAALSVFAHLLLMGYAYGTKMIFTIPAEPAGAPVQVTLLPDDWEETELPPQPQQARPWEQLSSEQSLEIQTQSPAGKSQHQPADLVRSATDYPLPQTTEPDWSSMTVNGSLDRPTRGNTAQAPFASIGVASAAAPIQQPSISEPGPRRSFQMDSLIQGEQFAGHLPSEAPPLQRSRTSDGDVSFDQYLREISDSLLESASTPAQITPMMVPLTPDRPSMDPESAGQGEQHATRSQQPTADQPDRDPTEARGQLASVSVAPPSSDDSASRTATQRQVERWLSEPRNRIGDARPIPPAYRLRRVDVRANVAKLRGGDESTERAVREALRWLSEQQLSDGRWDASHHGAGIESTVSGHNRNHAGTEADTGVTGLALLAFLGAGHTHLEGEYREVVRNGLNFLLANQNAAGSLAGDASFFAKMYCHGMALLAIGEAYGMTGDHHLMGPLERGVAYTVNAQHPRSGGWRYHPGDEEGDMSQFGWQLMALKSADLAGIAIPDRTRRGMHRFMASCRQGNHGGLSSYKSRQAPTPTMTAEAMACRLFLEEQLPAATVAECQDYIMANVDDRSVNFYWMYYGTLAMFLLDDSDWPEWNKKTKVRLVELQASTGEDAGSWDPDSVWGGYGGRVYSTALAALSLEIYYRYLPIYGGKAEPARHTAVRNSGWSAKHR